MVADGMVTQGARASAAIVVSWALIQYKDVVLPE